MKARKPERKKNVMPCPEEKSSQQVDHKSVSSVLLHTVQEEKKLILETTEASLVKLAVHEPAWAEEQWLS